MKTKSLLLGSLALVGLSTAGHAADLGVVTSLDVCDQLGLSGLTLSSDTNCLVVSGGVSMLYMYGSYGDPQAANGAPVAAQIADFGNGPAVPTLIYDDGTADSNIDIDAWLKFAATSETDFGPATATIKLISEDLSTTEDWSVGVDEAWVGIGDTTVIMAGYKSSIFNSGDDSPLNKYVSPSGAFAGLFYSFLTDPDPTPPDAPTDGVGKYSDTVADIDPVTGAAGLVRLGGAVVQIASNIGNGVSLSAGLEDLGSNSGEATATGTLSYAGKGLTAHVSAAANTASGNWITHSGFTGTWDPVTVVGALATDSSGYWNGLASAAVVFDIFRLAGSVEAFSDPAAGAEGWGGGGSLIANVSPGVSLNLGGRYFTSTVTGERIYQVDGTVSAAVAEAITLGASVGVYDTTFDVTYGFPSISVSSVGTFYYASVGVNWLPGGFTSGFVAGASLTLTSQGAYQLTTRANKAIN